VKSLLDPTFRYVPSTQTDIRKTFARVRREMRARERAPERGRERAGEALPPPRLTMLFPAHKRAG
jgi:hypothetical protein